VEGSNQDNRYQEAVAAYGSALERLARAYEADPDHRRDLLQEIHLALWRSFAGWDARCSLRTWVYRVAHNAAASHVIKQRRTKSYLLLSLEELDQVPAPPACDAGHQEALSRLTSLVHELKPLDRQIILSYLEGLDAAAIGEITCLAPGNVATKIHRIKSILTRAFHQGVRHAE
jgi:RNA polymerase sigma-70 factor (ECF subfamily)